MSENLIKLGIVIAISLLLINKLFWIAATVGIIWGGWKLFTLSEVYKKYSSS